MSSNNDNNNWKKYGKIAAITGGVILGAASIPILMGFGTAGIVGGSIAAGIQSAIGNVAAGGAVNRTGAEGAGQMNGNSAAAEVNSSVVCGKVSDDLYRWNKLELDIPKHSVKYDGHSIELTNREFIMLQVLLENMDIVLSRDTLLERVCGYDYLGETNVIDVYVRYLRSKIDEVYNVKMIQTVRGVGYVIKSE